MDKPLSDRPTETWKEGFRFRIWDMLVYTFALACFFATVRCVGFTGVLLLPGFLLGPPILRRPANSPRVKAVYLLVMVIAVLFIWRGE